MSGDVTAAIERLRHRLKSAHFGKGPMDWTDVHTLLAEVERLRAEREALHALHREVHAIFSWNSGIRYEEPCPDCHGAPGVHKCGCWADQQVEYVCAECHRLGGSAAAQWPCPTAVAALAADPGPAK